MIPVSPAAAHESKAYQPLLDMLSGVFITPKELADHYRYSEEHLCNLRRRKRGWPFIKLPTGGIRYRVSDVIAAEIRATEGPLTVDQVCLALAGCTKLTLEQRAVAQEHLRLAFETKGQPQAR